MTKKRVQYTVYPGRDVWAVYWSRFMWGSKANQWHVDVFWFLFINFKVYSLNPLKWWVTCSLKQEDERQKQMTKRWVQYTVYLGRDVWAVNRWRFMWGSEANQLHVDIFRFLFINFEVYYLNSSRMMSNLLIKTRGWASKTDDEETSTIYSISGERRLGWESVEVHVGFWGQPVTCWHLPVSLYLFLRYIL